MSIQFPAALVWPDNSFRVYYQEQAFVGSDGTQHPALAWSAWTVEDWATLCPDVRLLPVVDEPPAVTADQRLVRHVEEAWTLGADAVTVRYDVVNLTPAELAARAAAAGVTLKQQVAEAVQRHLDAAVSTRNYASAAAAVSYIDDPNPVWDAEGRAVRAWRSAVWQVCFGALDDVLAGRRAPLTPAEMVAELPTLIWPD